MSDAQLLAGLEAASRAAGAEVMAVYAGEIAVREKADASPVTEADLRAEAVIQHWLHRLAPEVPLVSEEQADAHGAPSDAPRFWLVDPLDGTKEFIQRNGEFTVNIALIEDGRPRLGVVFAPALGRLYLGARDLGAWRHDAEGVHAIRCRARPAEGWTMVASRSHGDAEALAQLMAGEPVAAQRSAGSSLKFCLLAEGEADLYPRLGRTMEWDTAAGHAVLAAAGGRVDTLDGTPLGYGKPGLAHPHFVAVAGPQAFGSGRRPVAAPAPPVAPVARGAEEAR
jgi:3'(2'), 5'-bisphosphate nucleotidase